MLNYFFLFLEPKKQQKVRIRECPYWIPKPSSPLLIPPLEQFAPVAVAALLPPLLCALGIRKL